MRGVQPGHGLQDGLPFHAALHQRHHSVGRLRLLVEVRGGDLPGGGDAGHHDVAGLAGNSLDERAGALRGFVVVVAAVLHAQHVDIERGPGGVSGRFGNGIESMAGRPERDDRFAGGHVRLQEVDETLGRCAATGAHHHQIRVMQPFDVREIRITFPGRGHYGADLIAAARQFCGGEGRQGFPSLVFVFADEQDDFLGHIPGEAEGGVAGEIGSRDARAPEPLDVLDHQFGAPKVRHVGRFAVVVHRVGHVAHEHHILPLLNHLADGEGPPQNAHVDVHSHDDDVGDTALAHEVQGLGRIGDGVAVADLEGRVLPGPRAIAGAFRAAVAAAVGVVDGQGGLMVGHPGTPALQRDGGLHGWSRLGEFPARVILVELQGVARAVENEHALGPGCLQHLVHGRGHFPDAFCGIRAMMLIPHIAHHHGRPRGLPGDAAFVGRGLGQVRGARAPAGVQGDGAGRGGIRGDRCQCETEADPGDPKAHSTRPQSSHPRITGDH